MQEQLNFIDGLYEKEIDENNLNELVSRTIGLLDFIISLKLYLIDSRETPKHEVEELKIQERNHYHSRGYLGFIRSGIELKEFKKIVLQDLSQDYLRYAHKVSRLDLKILLNKIVKNHDLSDTSNVAYKKAVELLSL